MMFILIWWRKNNMYNLKELQTKLEKLLKFYNDHFLFTFFYNGSPIASSLIINVNISFFTYSFGFVFNSCFAIFSNKPNFIFLKLNSSFSWISWWFWTCECLCLSWGCYYFSCFESSLSKKLKKRCLTA
jgi:hypothetical protein